MPISIAKQALIDGVAAIKRYKGPPKCRKCRAVIDFHYSTGTRKKMERNRLCFDCQYWNELAQVANDPRSVRIGGSHYWLGREDDTGTRGFGGEHFVLNFTDGRSHRRVETTNLWHQGLIPIRWRRHLRDNCRFLNTRLKDFKRAFARNGHIH